MRGQELSLYAADVNALMTEKGFITPNSLEGVKGVEMLAKLALVYSEWQEGQDSRDVQHLLEENADIIIRVLHILGGLGTDVGLLVHEILEEGRVRTPTFLFHKYLTSAIEAVRDEDLPTLRYNLGKIIVWVEENMETFYQQDVWGAVEKKMEVNRGRPYLHGRKSAA